MAAFKLLQDHFIGNQILPAGSIQQTADIAGGLLPANWRPTPNVEPLDTAAVNLFYALGPQQLGLVRQQFDGIPVALPVTRWVPGPGANQWSLTGLGASLGPASGDSLSLP